MKGLVEIMMKKYIAKVKLIALVLVLSIGILAAIPKASAIEETTNNNVSTTEITNTNTSNKTLEAAKTTTTEKSKDSNSEGSNKRTQSTEHSNTARKIAKLEATKLKVCQTRETNIKNILSRITDRNNKRIDTFNKIYLRVKDFYVSKGKILSNYDELVASVDAKKIAADSAAQTLSGSSTNFACDSDNPKEQASTFKTYNQNFNNAMKEYKTAIKDLIVGVKSVQDTTTSDTNKSSSEEK